MPPNERRQHLAGNDSVPLTASEQPTNAHVGYTATNYQQLLSFDMFVHIQPLSSATYVNGLAAFGDLDLVHLCKVDSDTTISSACTSMLIVTSTFHSEMALVLLHNAEDS